MSESKVKAARANRAKTTVEKTIKSGENFVTAVKTSIAVIVAVIAIIFAGLVFGNKAQASDEVDPNSDAVVAVEDSKSLPAEDPADTAAPEAEEESRLQKLIDAVKEYIAHHRGDDEEADSPKTE